MDALIMHRVEAQFAERCRAQGLKGKRLLDEQGAFYSGAIAGILASGIVEPGAACPPKWVIGIMSGRIIHEGMK